MISVFVNCMVSRCESGVALHGFADEVASKALVIWCEANCAQNLYANCANIDSHQSLLILGDRTFKVVQIQY